MNMLTPISLLIIPLSKFFY